MRYLGYTDATAMPVGPDGGIDVFSKNALAQVKWKQSVASRPDMQRLYGARAAQMHKQLYFFAFAGYSKHAIEYANTYNIYLFIYRPSGEIVPQNYIAAEVLKSAARTHGQQNQLAVIADMKNQKEANSALAGGICAAVLFFFITKIAIFDMGWSTYPAWVTIGTITVIILIDIIIIAGTVSAIHTKVK